MTTKQLTQLIGRCFLGAVALVLFVVISASVVGAYSPETLAWLHLDWLSVPLRGIYADCSLPENHNVGFCDHRALEAENSGAKLISEKRRPAPFTLYDR